MFLPGSTIGSANGQAYPSALLAVKLAAAASQTYEEMILEDLPEVYYRFQESTGVAHVNNGNGTIVDSSGHGRNGTVGTSSWAFINHQQPSAIQTPGTYSIGQLINSGSSYGSVAVYNDTFPSVRAGEFTLEMWFKKSAAPAAVKIMLGRYAGGGSSDLYLGIEATTGKAQFGGNAGAVALKSSASVCNNAWHHLVGLRRSGTMRLFVDGAEQASQAYAGDFNNTGTAWVVGAYGAALGSAFVPGPCSMDEVAIYHTALSDARVLAHYNKGVSG